MCTQQVPYSAVEREFWRLVNSMDDEVGVLIWEEGGPEGYCW